eukprot:COSAG06_NODE_7622_length_2436_cov_2.848524_2_plen_161_part_00
MRERVSHAATVAMCKSGRTRVVCVCQSVCKLTLESRLYRSAPAHVPPGYAALLTVASPLSPPPPPPPSHPSRPSPCPLIAPAHVLQRRRPSLLLLTDRTMPPPLLLQRGRVTVEASRRPNEEHPLVCLAHRELCTSSIAQASGCSPPAAKKPAAVSPTPT